MGLVACVAFAACDTTELVMGELNEGEAEDLAGAMLLATFSSTQNAQPAPAPGGPQMTPVEYTAEVDTEVECPLGGAVAVMADLVVNGDTDNPALVVDYSMTQVHDGCVVRSENDREFSLWGAPSLTLDLVVATDGEGVVEWEGSVVGAVSWVTDGRRGTCEVALEFGARAEGSEAFDAEVDGVVCGFNVARTLRVG